MKNKFKYLVKISLDRKIKTKWFKIVNVLLAVAIIALANIDNLINYFGGDFDNVTKIYVIDNTNKSYDLLNGFINESFKINDNAKYEVALYTDTKDKAIEMLKTDEEYDNLVLVIDEDDTHIINVTMVSNDFSNLSDLAILTNAVNSTKMVLAIDEYNISEEQLAGITDTITINREVLDEKKDSTDENMGLIMSTVFPIVILPFFMLTIFLVQMIGAEVNDEKTTRGMEIIIANVSPKAHFFAKCVSGNAFVLFQGLLLIIYIALGILSRRFFGPGNSSIMDLISGLDVTLPTEFINSLIYLIPILLILMIITFVGYSLVAGILASMTTNTEDFQQIQSPIVLTSLFGYYLAMMAGMFKGAVFIKILGYVPFISAILAPSLFVLGDFTIIDLVISIALMSGVVYLLIKYGLKVYKVGILNYSSGDLWKKMFKALKDKD